MGPRVYTFCLDSNSEGIDFLEPKLVVKVSSTFFKNIFIRISFRLNIFVKDVCCILIFINVFKKTVYVPLVGLALCIEHQPVD